jgi:hypothetical protein
LTPAELREAAIRQNDRDHAAGLLPSRYVEDPSVLAEVARLLRGTEHANGKRPAAKTPTARSRTRRKAAS